MPKTLLIIFEKIEQLDPAQPNIKINLGNLYRLCGKLEKSIEIYERVLQLNQHIHEQFKKKAVEIKKTSNKKKIKK